MHPKSHRSEVARKREENAGGRQQYPSAKRTERARWRGGISLVLALLLILVPMNHSSAVGEPTVVIEGEVFLDEDRSGIPVLAALAQNGIEDPKENLLTPGGPYTLEVFRDPGLTDRLDSTVTTERHKFSFQKHFDDGVPLYLKVTLPEMTKKFFQITRQVSQQYANHFNPETGVAIVGPGQPHALFRSILGLRFRDVIDRQEYETYKAMNEASFGQYPWNKLDAAIADHYSTITFDAGQSGSITGGTRQYYVDQRKTVTLVAPTVSPVEGKKFVGWDVDLSNRIFSESMTIHAQYEEAPIVSHKVQYRWKDGEPHPQDAVLPDSYPVAEQQTYTIAPPPTTSLSTAPNGKKGTWFFAGWRNDAGEVVSGTQIMGTHDVTLTGTWTFTEAEYGVTYAWDGTSPAGIEAPADRATYKEGASVPIAEAPDASKVTTNAEGREGTWSFVGWKDATGKDVSDTAAMPAGGLTLTGTWIFTEAEYGVTYAWDGTSPAGIEAPADRATYKEGASVPIAEAPDASKVTTNAEGRKGTWSFVGWKDATGKDVSDTAAMPADGLTLTGTWIFTEKQESSEPSSSEKPVISEESGMSEDSEIPEIPPEEPPQEPVHGQTGGRTAQKDEKAPPVRKNTPKTQDGNAPKTGVESPIGYVISVIAATGILTAMQRSRVRSRQGRRHD
ncbi:MAG: SHIRT domain-containing protein [Peptoniphilaceae bacterium]|nr:SHIRT domain-containing protein [Peptoniphilaceae bacterium]